MFAAVLRAAALLQPLLDDDLAGPADRSELAALLPLPGLERFNRRATNRAPAGLTEKQRRVA